MTHRPALALVLAAALALAALPGCARKDVGAHGRHVIQNKGSDTLVNIAQAWAEEYKKLRPEVEIEVSGGGSGVGIAALSKGAVDIANSSRNMKQKEKEDALANTGKAPHEIVVGFDALAIFVHKDNPIEEITLEQLAQIYAEGGKFTRWSDLGVRMEGNRDKIIRISRQSSSGTYEFLRSRVLKNVDFKLGSCDLNGSKEVVELVANTPGAIAYSGMGYATSAVKMLKVKEKPDSPAVMPSEKTAMDKSYPISRSLLMYTLGEPTGEVRNYLDWVQTDAGQTILKQNGYVPVRELAAK